MKRLLTIFLILKAFTLAAQNPTPVPSASGIVYVKQSGAGTKTGDSWANAAPELADVLVAAKNNTSIQQIWAAGGTYKPLYRADNLNGTNANDRYNAFVLVKDVKVYGGFAGTEATLANRNLSLIANASILSGDLDHNDTQTNGVSTTINGSNAYHVLVASGNAGTAELNGFTVTGGKADLNTNINVNGNQLSQNNGAGMYNVSTSLVLSQLIFAGNTANDGAAIYNISSTPSIINSTFKGNTANNAGGGIYNTNSSLSLKNSLFSGNKAVWGGAVFKENGGTDTYLNCTMGGNRATSGGDGINIKTNTSTVHVRNSILYSNGTGTGANVGDIRNDGNNTTINVQNSLYGKLVGSIVDQGNNSTANPMFENPISAFSAPTSNGNYALQDISPAIGTGDNTLYGVNLNIDNDLTGNLRLNSNNIDMGAYEYPAPTTTPDANGILYVDAIGSGNKTGDSWANAAEIRPAFIAARNNTAIQQIWIKAGTYYPTNDNNRNKYLEITRNIKVYGGFAGTETNINDRNLQTNISTLSGNIGNAGSFSDNSYHLLVIWPKNDAILSNQTVVDGITFSDANANSGAVFNNELPLYMGSAVFVTIQDFSQKNQAAISNCKFVNNFAYQGGAAIYYDGLLAINEHFKVENCYFENNRSEYVGGALFFYYEPPNAGFGYNPPPNVYYNIAINNCVFKGNKVNNNSQGRGAESSGGAIVALNKGTVEIRNSTFFENTSDITYTAHGYATYGNGSGVAAVKDADVSIINSLFYNNNKAAIFNREANVKLINTTVHHATNELVALSMSKKLELYNSILWNDASNTSAFLLPDNQPVTAIANHSIFNTSANITFTSQANNISQNPLFTNAANNDFSLQGSSPAINVGDNSLYEPQISLAADKDLAGNDRLQTTTVDIGAYEYTGTLPVELLSFKLDKQNNGVLLTWKTATETNNKGFNVLRSGNGADFIPIQHIKAKGAGNYVWLDNNPLSGQSYYQLQQEDLNGDTEIVGQGTINFELSGEISAYPNPTKDMVNIRVNGNNSSEARLFDISGRLLQSRAVKQGNQMVSFNLSAYAPGLYVIRLIGGQTQTLKIIKQ